VAAGVVVVGLGTVAIALGNLGDVAISVVTGVSRIGSLPSPSITGVTSAEP